MEDPQKQRDYNELRPYQFKKGQSGNPGGRPKGSVSLKTYAREMLEKMNDDERQEFLNGLAKEVIWEMAEGKAQSNTDLKLTGDIKVNIVKYGDDKSTV
jgi:hypothetical protein